MYVCDVLIVINFGHFDCQGAQGSSRRSGQGPSGYSSRRLESEECGRRQAETVDEKVQVADEEKRNTERNRNSGISQKFLQQNDFTGLLTCIEMAPALFSSGAISPYLSPLWHSVFLEMPLHICLLCNIVYFLKCLFIFVSQRRHGFCRRHCRLQEKNVSLRHSAPQVHR